MIQQHSTIQHQLRRISCGHAGKPCLAPSAEHPARQPNTVSVLWPSQEITTYHNTQHSPIAQSIIVFATSPKMETPSKFQGGKKDANIPRQNQNIVLALPAAATASAQARAARSKNEPQRLPQQIATRPRITLQALYCLYHQAREPMFVVMAILP